MVVCKGLMLKSFTPLTTYRIPLFLVDTMLWIPPHQRLSICKACVLPLYLGLDTSCRAQIRGKKCPQGENCQNNSNLPEIGLNAHGLKPMLRFSKITHRVFEEVNKGSGAYCKSWPSKVNSFGFG